MHCAGDGVVQCYSDEDDGIFASPAESDIRTLFKAIEDVAVISAVDDAVFYLSRAKSALLSAKREKGMELGQTLIIEFL